MNPAAPLTCLVVDDNEMNRFNLEHLIELTPQLHLTASFNSAVDCLAFFTQGGRADVLFLDIEMPELSGLDLVRILPVPPPDIVLVTSHRDYAVDAFDLNVGVSDYLVKPVELPRFLQAVQRVVAHRQAASAPAESKGPAETALADPRHLFVKVNKKLMRVNLGDILYVEALSDYCVLVLDKQKLIVYSTLRRLEERLPTQQFARVHRSYIVNMRRIETVEDHMVQFARHEVPVGKSYQEGFQRQLRDF
ncbi:LytTR family DNA-binding domain-containing protein [Hymenobacter sp. 5317J-9]|uniref:LytR/AlgR family response regulator transcription factor n=1 Tax=Hymenobacter sp. 5317J-9 TaxID=2932250 RepID=UPI001FD688A1|nr:LytTR family DNA-binding domain-containing protein [Hymenobacter sp. 5317J-9]UOQ97157.1 LytTR family DNA-binding domain-containing protein [Hymenobacter sp. 5317J-9]